MRPVTRTALGVFAAAVGAVLVFWAVVPGGWDMFGSPDFSSFYWPVGHNLAEGRGLVTAAGEPAVRYPPGFPLLVAMVVRVSGALSVPEVYGLQGVTLLITGLTAVCLWAMARLVIGPLGALIAAALWITYPFGLWLTNYASSEVPFMLPLYGALLLFTLFLVQGGTGSLWKVAGAGFLLGGATLVRPMGLLVAPLLALLLLVLRGRQGGRHCLQAVGVLVAGYLVVLVPWEVWAYRHTGRWIPVSTAGALAVRDGLAPAIRTKGGTRRELAVSPRLRAFMEEVVRDYPQLKESRALRAFLLAKMRDDPVAMLYLLWWKSRRAWYGTESQTRAEIWIAAVQGAYLLMAALGAVLLWRAGGVGREWLVVSGWVVLCFWGMTILALTILRYMVPVMGLLFTWQAVFLTHCWDRWIAVRRRASAP